jgi:MarR family 2-MHQ and catechol resistance regulon transcriptional repressor
MPTRYQGTTKEQRALNAVIALMRAANAVHGGFAALRADDGITMTQFAVLEALLHCGSLCQRDLAAKLLVTGANMTNVIDLLEREDLVRRVRDQQDRRYITVELTAKGRRKISEIFPRHVADVVKSLSALSADEQEQLRALCKKLGLAQTTHQEKK